MKRFVSIAFLVVMAALFAFPIVVTVVSSFMSPAELSEVFSEGGSIRLIPKMVSLNAYSDLLFSGSEYLRMFWNSLFIALATALGSTVVGLIVGYALAKCKFRGKDILRYLYIVIMMMPFQVTLLSNYILVRRLSLYNTLWSLIIPGIFAPMAVFLVSQFIRGISNDEIEAATLETTSPITVLAHVVAPRVYPALLAAFLMSFAEAWNMVEQPLIYLSDESLYPLSLALNSMQSGNMSVAFAGSVMYMLPIILLYRIFEEELIQGLSASRFR